MDYSYTSYKYQYCYDRLANLDYSRVSPIEQINTEFIQKYIDNPVYDSWVDLSTGEAVESIPAGTLVMDVETSDDTRTLALGSCYHFELDKWYYFISSVGKYDNLLDVADGSYIIAHRAAFENSFIRQNYQGSQPGYRSFCTYAVANARLHPLKPSLYRAMPWLPMFAQSNDCSLASLYEQATNNILEKDAVEIFISSKGDDWRYSEPEVLIKKGIYQRYLEGVAKKFLPDNAPAEMHKLVGYKYPKLPTKKAERQALYESIMEKGGHIDHDDKLLLHALERRLKIENPYTYESTHMCEEQYTSMVMSLFPDVLPRDQQGLIYNLKDVRATVDVTRFLVMDGIVNQISAEDFEGMQIRLQPMYALDPEFTSQVDKIERTYNAYKNRLQIAANYNVEGHVISGGDWDGQDWSVNTKGRTRWYEPAKVGYTKTLNAIASRIHYQGLPLKRVKAHKPVQTVDGEWIFPHVGMDKSILVDESAVDFEKQRSYWAYEKNPRTDLTYEERLALMDGANTIPLENPESTEPKTFKSVINFFSRTLLKHWQSGTFTCDEPGIQQAIPDFISTSYWTSIRKRILGIKIVKDDEIEDLSFVAPRPSVHGTVSGRSIDPLFLVLSTYDPNKIGSELAGMFVAPPGYTMFSFDLDSCQARIGAVISDAWYAKLKGWNKVRLGETELSKAVLYGEKHNRTTLAHKLGDNYLGFDLSNPKQADKSYSYGKNAQFALYFGVAARKLSKMLNIPYELAERLVIGWKGIRDPQDKTQWINGTASDLINAQQALSNRYYPSMGDASVWTRHSDVLGIVSTTRLPHVLDPRYSGRDYITTKYNANIQNGDAAMMNLILSKVDHEGHTVQGLDFRFCSSIHDYYAWFVKDSDVDQFRTVAREAHKATYLQWLTRWNVDLDTVPDAFWYPSSTDITRRLVKKEEDELQVNSKTLSFAGYNESLWSDYSIDEAELAGLEDTDD